MQFARATVHAPECLRISTGFDAQRARRARENGDVESFARRLSERKIERSIDCVSSTSCDKGGRERVRGRSRGGDAGVQCLSRKSAESKERQGEREAA